MLMKTSVLVFRWLMLGSLTLGLVALPRTLLSWHYRDRIYTLNDLPQVGGEAAAVVFGAGLRRDGGPTRVLADRVATAAALHTQGLASQLLLSGSVRAGYDEPEAMRGYARALGVPEAAIQLDQGGTRTIETCRNAKALGFSTVLLVSQRYHLPRALATCAGLGLEAYGVAADLRRYRSEPIWTLREYPATLIALYETYLRSAGIDSDHTPSEVTRPYGS